MYLHNFDELVIFDGQHKWNVFKVKGNVFAQNSKKDPATILKGNLKIKLPLIRPIGGIVVTHKNMMLTPHPTFA